MEKSALRRIRRNHRRIRWRNLLSMRTFVCFDFTSEMRRNISTRKSRNHFYFFVTKKFAKHFKPIRIRNFFRREFADDFVSWKSAFMDLYIFRVPQQTLIRILPLKNSGEGRSLNVSSRGSLYNFSVCCKIIIINGFQLKSFCLLF